MVRPASNTKRRHAHAPRRTCFDLYAKPPVRTHATTLRVADV